MALLASCTSAAGAQHPELDGQVLLFGNLHAHSALSDDVDERGEEMKPARAFAYADAHGLDFLAISDHHKALDARGPELRLTPEEYRTELLEAAMQYNAARAGEFIAIPAIEWGTTSTGNHVNLFGLRELPPDSILDAEYEELFDWAGGHAEFIQFNHPYSWQADSKRNKAVGNFGEGRYADTAAWVRAVGPAVRTISIISSVPRGHITGPLRHREDNTHRDHSPSQFNIYRRYLNAGLHVSPAANQDTHWRNWGTVTAARTAVWAAAPDYAALMNAIRANRVYATEDDRLVVAFRVRHNGVIHWMGDSVALEEEGNDVQVLVRIWQASGFDEGPYAVTLYRDVDGVGGREAGPSLKLRGIATGEERSIPLRVRPGEYLFLEVTEMGGKDHLEGEGQDRIVNATGEPGSDGQRDNLNDSAWTSPLWFSGAPQRVLSPGAP